VGARFGRYETLRPIASGGMATVYLGRAVGAGGFERLVAVKVLHEGLAGDGDFVAMFLDEARVAARIRHPNVVATLDVEQGPDGLFLVMEFVEGPSLSAINRALRKKRRRLPIGVALRIVVDALLGLHAAHEQTGARGEPLHVVHRDVSPHNVLVGVDGLAKITDFGVAQAEARLSSTRGNTIKGKLSYMAPQQVRQEPLDRRADVYAAGVVLWEVLTGEPLFTGDNDGALLMAVLAGPARSPRLVVPDVPAEIDGECMRALSAHPDGRHLTALAFAEALEHAAESAGVSLATPRALATFVKELGVHQPIDQLPVAMGAGPPHPSPARSTSPPESGRVEPATPAPVPAAAPDSQVASVLTRVDVPGAGRRSRLILGGAVLLAAAAGAVVGAHFLGTAPAPASAAITTGEPTKPSAQPIEPSQVEAPKVSVASAAPPPAAQAASAPPAKTVTPKTRSRSGGDDWRPQGL
jgi:serine/threonine-protein kinase